MRFDPCYVPYPSTRYPVYASRGMVAASSPQAAAAGLDALKRGGNAVDAAVATAAALTVVEPTANGIGGDAFALIWIEKDKRLYGLNASGWSPRDVSIEKISPLCPGGRMPAYGWLPVMVPGAPKAWAEAINRFGRLSLTSSMSAAVDYAQDGYPASPNLARMWGRAANRYAALRGDRVFDEWFRAFLPDGKAPEAGQTVRLPDHAATLREIAETGADSFYRGNLARRIVADSAEFGGFFCLEDFSEYRAQWVEPVSVNYRGITVCEMPPNGQGVVALMALNILSQFSFSVKEEARAFHTQIEAMKLAFADGLRYVTDPKDMRASVAGLLSAEYAKRRAALIADRAGEPMPGTPPGGGTVYFATADGEGNMVSWIQSNYMGFGSGVVVQGTGIALQNRGHDFSLDPNAANCLAPRKKSYHTIIPGFLMKNGEALGPFGVMGGYMQPQGHVQVVMNLVDFNLNPPQALDAPRWQWTRGKSVLLENGFDPRIARELAALGHDTRMEEDSVAFGRGQVILRDVLAALVGGTERRTDSSIACY